MNRGSNIVIVLALIAGLVRPVTALELFGVDLESTNRAELRNAVKAAGVKLVREGDDETLFDVYDSSVVLLGSNRLYLGFVVQSQGFAFAEYEFEGLNPKPILSDLTRKYGVAEIHKGRFVSDRKYRWQRDGIEIELSGDWQNYRIRLSYIHPENMAELRAEQSGVDAPDRGPAEGISLY